MTHGTSERTSWASSFRIPGVFDRLTLNFGVRMETRTSMPATNRDRIPDASIIDFKLWEQLAPRVGFTFDLLGNGTSKLFGSYGRFFEMMPLDLDTRQFGGEDECLSIITSAILIL